MHPKQTEVFRSGYWGLAVQDLGTGRDKADSGRRRRVPGSSLICTGLQPVCEFVKLEHIQEQDGQGPKSAPQGHIIPTKALQALAENFVMDRQADIQTDTTYIIQICFSVDIVYILVNCNFLPYSIIFSEEGTNDRNRKIDY